LQTLSETIVVPINAVMAHVTSAVTYVPIVETLKIDLANKTDVIGLSEIKADVFKPKIITGLTAGANYVDPANGNFVSAATYISYTINITKDNRDFLYYTGAQQTTAATPAAYFDANGVFISSESGYSTYTFVSRRKLIVPVNAVTARVCGLNIPTGGSGYALPLIIEEGHSNIDLKVDAINTRPAGYISHVKLTDPKPTLVATINFSRRQYRQWFQIASFTSLAPNSKTICVGTQTSYALTSVTKLPFDGELEDNLFPLSSIVLYLFNQF